MKSNSFLFPLPCLLSFLLLACQQPGISIQAGPHDLLFEDLPHSWDEGLPLGNGFMGALIWEKEDHLRFSLDRIDLWDLRPMRGLDLATYNFQWVQQQWQQDTYEEVQKRLDHPYDREAGPTKIPGAALEFDISQLGVIQSAHLSVEHAVCEIKWKNGPQLQSFLHANVPVGWFRFSGVPDDFEPILVPPIYQDTSQRAEETNPVTGQSLLRLGYAQGNLFQKRNSITYVQEGWGGFWYQVHVTWQRTSDEVIGLWSISSHHPDQQQKQEAEEIVLQELTKGFDTSFSEHQDWWQSFWEHSTVRLPDSLLERQWYLEMYKFGSVSRNSSPPISLQTVWTADNGRIPPWKGDLHHDLNTQMSYWPAYSSNHLDHAESFVNWMWDHRETFKSYTQTYYGTKGLNVPGVSTQAGQPMGGWIQYSLGPTVSAWLAQHFYLQWQYSRDRDFLEEKAYPWIKDVAIHLDELSIRTKNGQRSLPLSSSPEIYDNSPKAWFAEMTNFDLALIRWTFQTAAELAIEIGEQEEAEQWTNILAEWPEYAIDESGLLFAPGLPYDESHRHFSHLMAIHPLGLIDVSHGVKDKEIIQHTIATLDAHGSDAWIGFSFAWLGNLKARALDGEGAAKALRIFAEAFCLPNSFHVNGDQSGKGYSNYTYRPFTLEGNFAFAAGIQEMLLQSHAGHIAIFPAIPNDWQEVSFSQLRAQGAFLVSAKRTEGQLGSVEILAEKGGKLQVKNSFADGKFQTDHPYTVVESNIIEMDLEEGEKVLLSR
ncbi:MAG: glycoside hydrolase family 95-like protein [Bacteroidota bacterium]